MTEIMTDGRSMTDTTYSSIMNMTEDEKVDSLAAILKSLLQKRGGVVKEDTVRGVMELHNEMASRQLLLNAAYEGWVDFGFRGEEMYVQKRKESDEYSK